MNISQKIIIRKINEFMKMHDDAVYVSNYPIFEASKQFAWKKIDPRVKVRFLKKFDSGIVRNTTSYIYEISKTNSDLP